MTQTMQPRVLGRYLFYAPIASGGMATVYLARMAGPKGFSRIVAIKQLHAQFVHDSDFVTMFLDEAHLIGRIHHSNVVAPIDVVEADGDLCIVMEYVHGEALGRLMRLSRREHMPLRVVTAIMVQTLLGLHAAHEVTDPDGSPLSIVHLDVSPANVLVGEDGIARVVDFGIAQAAHRSQPTTAGKLKGKLGYMAPEQLMSGALDRRSDIFSAGIILWEMLTGKKLFAADSPEEAVELRLRFELKPPSSLVASIPPELDAIATKALSIDPNGRYATAHEMARELEMACAPAGAIEVAEWVKRLVGDRLATRAQWISELSAMDLGEWTQTYVMSSSLPMVVNAAPFANREDEISRATNSVPTQLAPEDPAVNATLTTTTAPSTSTTPPSGAPNKPATSVLKSVIHSTAFRFGATALSLLVLGLTVTLAPHWRRGRSAQAHPVTVLAAMPQASVAVLPQASAAALPTASKEQALPPASKDAPSAATSASPEPIQSPELASASAKTPDGAAAAAIPSVAMPSATASAAPAPAPSSQAKSPAHSAPARSATAAAQPDCKVPYVIDSRHIKRFRSECFRKH